MERVEIVDYPGYYAREDGRIENKLGNIISSWIDNVGYHQIVLYKNKKRCYLRVHRLIAKALIPNPENKAQVDHVDGNKLNNHVDNLRWVSNRENTQCGYDANAYLSTSHVSIKATHKENKNEQIFHSIRACAETLRVNRKTLSSILKTGKSNNYNYDFEICVSEV